MTRQRHSVQQPAIPGVAVKGKQGSLGNTKFFWQLDNRPATASKLVQDLDICITGSKVGGQDKRGLLPSFRQKQSKGWDAYSGEGRDVVSML